MTDDYFRNGHFVKMMLHDGQQNFIFPSLRYTQQQLRKFHPLCYEVTPYHLQRDRTIYFDKTMTDLRLFPRSDDFYLDFLFRFKNSKDFVYYSDLSSEDKNCADVFYQIHLLNIDHNFIIFLHDNIKIWETCYNRSFNWYEYYLLDLKNDEYGRLKGVSHE